MGKRTLGWLSILVSEPNIRELIIEILTLHVKITMMIDRQTLLTLSERLHEAPAVVLLGPRQVGKTTLALTLADSWPAGATYLDLERPADRLRLQDADAFLRAQGGKLVLQAGSVAGGWNRCCTPCTATGLSRPFTFRMPLTRSRSAPR